MLERSVRLGAAEADVPALMTFIAERFAKIDHACCDRRGPLSGPEYLFEIEMTANEQRGRQRTGETNISLCTAAAEHGGTRGQLIRLLHAFQVEEALFPR